MRQEFLNHSEEIQTVNRKRNIKQLQQNLLPKTTDTPQVIYSGKIRRDWKGLKSSEVLNTYFLQPKSHQTNIQEIFKKLALRSLTS